MPASTGNESGIIGVGVEVGSSGMLVSTGIGVGVSITAVGVTMAKAVVGVTALLDAWSSDENIARHPVFKALLSMSTATVMLLSKRCFCWHAVLSSASGD